MSWCSIKSRNDLSDHQSRHALSQIINQSISKSFNVSEPFLNAQVERSFVNLKSCCIGPFLAGGQVFLECSDQFVELGPSLIDIVDGDKHRGFQFEVRIGGGN